MLDEGCDVRVKRSETVLLETVVTCEMLSILKPFVGSK